MGLDATRIPAGNPTSRTLDTRHYPSQLPVRACHPLTGRFPAHFPSLSGDRHGSEHHIRTPFQGAFSLPCALFTRRYWGRRIFFLFLRLIRCFNSPRSPSKSGNRLTHLKMRPFIFPIWNKWDVPFGNAWFEGCMRLARPFRSLPRPSSPVEPSNPPNSMGASYLCSGSL